MRQKKVEGEYQGDSWSRPNGRRPWSKPIPPRTTRYCDGPRVPDRSMVGTWYTPLHDPSFAKRARIVPQRTNNGVHMRGIAQVLGRLRDDLVVRRPWGLGCQIQRHRGSGRCALDIPLNRRIPHAPRSIFLVESSCPNFGSRGRGILRLAPVDFVDFRSLRMTF